MNIQIKETRNAELVISIARELFDDITDDEGSALGKEAIPGKVMALLNDPANHALQVDMDDKCVGCFMLEARGIDCLFVHTLFLPACRGHAAIVAGRSAMKLIAELFGIHKLKSVCPMNKKEVLLYAIRCGFKRVETVIGGWIKNGVSYDLVRVEATI